MHFVVLFGSTTRREASLFTTRSVSASDVVLVTTLASSSFFSVNDNASSNGILGSFVYGNKVIIRSKVCNKG